METTNIRFLFHAVQIGIIRKSNNGSNQICTGVVVGGYKAESGKTLSDRDDFAYMEL